MRFYLQAAPAAIGRLGAALVRGRLLAGMFRFPIPSPGASVGSAWMAAPALLQSEDARRFRSSRWRGRKARFDHFEPSANFTPTK